MAAYIIVRAKVSDWERYQRYTKLTPEIIEKYHGKFIVRGGEKVTLEGAEETARIVVIEFPSLEKAIECYNSPEYGRAKEMRAGAAETQFVAVEGS
jgi:uncharacterized protein (DUF1330 family)